MSEVTKQTIAVGRIEYLTCKGVARYSIEYVDEESLIKEIKECLNYGVPINIVLYRDENGKTVSKNFVEDIDCLPAGFQEIDNPYLRTT